MTDELHRELEVMARLSGKQGAGRKAAGRKLATLTLKKPSLRTFTRPGPPEKSPRQIRVEAVRDYILRRYPDLFRPDKPVPLAIKIHGQLTLPKDTSKRTLRLFLAEWCNQPRYLRSIAEGGDRHGPAGPCGAVTRKQREFAKWKLKRMKSSRE